MSDKETVGEQREDHTGDDCGICGDPIEHDWVRIFEGVAHPECDEQRFAEAMEAYRNER